MDNKIIFDTITHIPWLLLLQLSVVGIVTLVLKRYYDNIASYLMFRANRDLGKNVKIKVNGQTGYIVHYTWRFIYVKLEESENELIIPITRWTVYNWEIIKNGKMKRSPVERKNKKGS